MCQGLVCNRVTAPPKRGVAVGEKLVDITSGIANSN